MKPFTFDRVVRIVIAVIIAIALLMLVNRLSSVLIPFAVAWFIAYLMYPVTKFIQYRMHVRNRPLSILLTFVLVIASFSLLLAIVIPPIISEFSRAGFLMSSFFSNITDSTLIPETTKSSIISWFEFANANIISKFTGTDLSQVLRNILPRLWTLISGSFDLILSLFVVFVVFMYVVFILLDYEVVGTEFRSMLPKKYRDAVEMIIRDLEDGMNTYFRGQFLVAAIVGILLAAGLAVVGLPLGVLLGLLMGLLTIVPYLKLVLLPVVAFFAFVGAQQLGEPFYVMAVKVTLVIGGVQIIEDMFLVPKIMRKRMGLNPAVILLSLSVWGSLLGIVGMIIALPATTILISYYKRYILVKLEHLNTSGVRKSDDVNQGEKP